MTLVVTNPHRRIHRHLVAKPENYTSPTYNPADCICGGAKSEGKGRTLIANCPCCDGVQTLVEGDDCNCEYGAVPLRVTLPTNCDWRIRYIDTVRNVE